MNLKEIKDIIEDIGKNRKNPTYLKGLFVIIICVIGYKIIDACITGYFTEISKDHAKNISKIKSVLQDRTVIIAEANRPESVISNSIKQDIGELLDPYSSTITSYELNIEINPNIPREWSDPTLGIEFVRAGDDNYWITKDEITIFQFSRYKDIGFIDVDHDQSPDCISIGSLKNKSNIENNSHSVTCISWKEARDFAEWLTEKDKIGTFSIPTKREWQRACEKGLINSSTLEWSTDKRFSNTSDDPTYLVVGRPSNQSSLNCNSPDSGYAALQRRSDVGFRLVWRPK